MEIWPQSNSAWCVSTSGGTMEEENGPTQNDTQSKQRTLLKSAACGLYGMVTSVLAIVIPVSYHLGHGYATSVVYDAIFYFYMFAVSIFLMVYIMIRVRIETGNMKRINNGSGNEEVLPPVIKSHDTLSHYRIFGAAMFMLVSCGLDIIFLIGYVEDGNVLTCYGVSGAVFTALRLCFIITQCVFFIMHYSTIINFNIDLVRFALVHLASANMCNWGLTLLLEATIDEGEEAPGHPTYHSEFHIILEDLPNNSYHRDMTTIGNEINCKDLGTTSASVSQHLFAFLIEFSMLSIGFCHDMYQRIGTKPPEHPHGELIRVEDSNIQNDLCFYNFKYISGLVCGGIIILLAISSSLLFGLIRDERLDFPLLSDGDYLFLYYGTSLVTTFLSLILTIRGLTCLLKLHFIPNAEFFFDEVLLVVSLVGTYFMMAFLTVAAFYQIKKDTYTLLCTFYIADGILTYVQTSVQYLLIRNGVHRRAVLRRHLKDQPGRACMSFLMLTNLAQWVALSFMIVALKGSRILIQFYGKNTWVVVSNLLVPMFIFHRFHAGACLAEIYEKTYKLPILKTE